MIIYDVCPTVVSDNTFFSDDIIPVFVTNSDIVCFISFVLLWCVVITGPSVGDDTVFVGGREDGVASSNRLSNLSVAGETTTGSSSTPSVYFSVGPTNKRSSSLFVADLGVIGGIALPGDPTIDKPANNPL
eukprot:CAMPEP_0194174728 /NCGR_PEP_ID=MMETSP0154-20130528/8886_1 /TAXON_ID=1049557 /ORGANISM="Thalassiothrix antarctica, Strain L6-D1" /LENGTH=130 /DNA_ID=CAMNT_0038888283 /DNA_START=293 /DNA_END=683 /DNA_ORIENTATION=+